MALTLLLSGDSILQRRLNSRDDADLKPLFELLLSHIPPPVYTPGHGLQALVTNLDATPFLGRIALCRVMQGTIRKGQMVAWCRADGSTRQVNAGIRPLTWRQAILPNDGSVLGNDW